MAQRRSKRKEDQTDSQMGFDFEAVITNAEVLTREDVAAKFRQEDTYNPIEQTAAYMQRLVQAEDAWETTLQRARHELLRTDARQLYCDLIADIVKQIQSQPSRASRLSNLLHMVAIRGLGMTREQIRVSSPARGATRWTAEIDRNAVLNHVENHIVGDNFLNFLEVDESMWNSRSPVIGGSDVSQHRSAVPVPSRFFRRSVPFVLNNAAGSLFTLHQNGEPQYENLYNPKPSDELLRWMLIDPSYQDQLEAEDYQRIVASAMDVGQYKFDLNYLLKTDKRTPDVIFRDGSLFPQDAYIDNYVLNTRRGEFIREAIIEFLNCLTFAQEMETVYCGVAKTTVLKVYSAVVDWYVAKYVDSNWDIGNYILSDGQSMSILLASPDFVATNLQRVVTTCLIRRSFTTRAALNEKVPEKSTIESYINQREVESGIKVRAYQRLCELAHLYMFFIGHSKSPQQQLPRYEFFHTDKMGKPEDVAKKILTALQNCSLVSDRDHSFMTDEPIVYLLPSVTQQAHNLSKDVGKYIDRATGQWIMSQYRRMVDKN